MFRRKRHSLGGLVLKALMALVVLGLFAYHFGIKTSELFPTKMIVSIINNNTQFNVSEKQLKDVLDVIDPNDLGELESIVKGHISVDGITRLVEDFRNQDVGNLSTYFNGNLSEDEKDKMNEIFDKYKDELGEKIQNIIPSKKQ